MPTIQPHDRAEHDEYAALLHAAGIRFRFDTGGTPVFGFRIPDDAAVPAGIPADRVSGAVIRFAPDPTAAGGDDQTDDGPGVSNRRHDTPAADGDQADEPTPADGEPDAEPSPTPSRKPQRRKGRN